jgi:hypothetical protein
VSKKIDPATCPVAAVHGAGVLLLAPVFPENMTVFTQGDASEAHVLDPVISTVLED